MNTTYINKKGQRVEVSMTTSEFIELLRSDALGEKEVSLNNKHVSDTNHELPLERMFAIFEAYLERREAEKKLGRIFFHEFHEKKCLTKPEMAVIVGVKTENLVGRLIQPLTRKFKHIFGISFFNDEDHREDYKPTDEAAQLLIQYFAWKCIIKVNV